MCVDPADQILFPNVSNIILNVSQYTAYGCSTCALTPQTCCSREERWDWLPQEMLHMVIYQHLTGRMNRDLQIFLG